MIVLYMPLCPIRDEGLGVRRPEAGRERRHPFSVHTVDPHPMPSHPSMTIRPTATLLRG